PATSPSRKGELTAAYDPAGNLTSLLVRRGTGPSDAPCLPAGASCWHRFAYDWDEVGRLIDARRWDQTRLGEEAGPDADVHLKYSYDANDRRVLKTATSGTNELYTVYVFGSLELRRAHFESNGTEAADYERTASTETPYLLASGVRLGR